ncbi:unnamed protein product [Rotaria magnacalcarata]|uniref:FLYWCH-type domain-containing protein n=1 Tax=Rotaria magnacalcarata TaxID=392030 RepID=A0A816NS92_9BILA|nr:unnamed protein product [Rotaria magnacalcarata]
MSAKFVESTHGKKHLCYLGYRYFAKRKNLNGSEYWICVKCSATATSYADSSVVVRDEHTHLPDATDREVLEMRKNLKRKIIDESGSVDSIVEEAYHAIHAQPQSTDLIINLPAIRTIKNTSQKQRRKTRPPIPLKIEQFPFPLPDVYCKSTQGEWFLLYDGLLDATRSLIFATYNDIVSIYHSKKIGTVTGHFIHVHPFFIRYIRFMHIMTDYQHHAFLPYLAVNPNKLILRTITIDFELGVSNVFTKHYPSVIVRGCLFHFGQSLFRKFVDLGLKAAYNDNENLCIWFRSFAALSLLPLNHMLQGLQCLTSTRPEYPNIQGFLDYYHNTYGPFSKFPPHMYNLYRNITPRTINYLEGRHSRMKKHVNSPHPNIFMVIDFPG